MLGSKNRQPVVLAVASGGGHWVQMRRLAPAFAGAEVHYATTDLSAADQVGASRLHVYPDANKDTPFLLFVCVLWSNISWPIKLLLLFCIRASL